MRIMKLMLEPALGAIRREAALVAVTLTALAVRFVVFFLPGRGAASVDRDSDMYQELARALPGSYTDPTSPLEFLSFLRPPGYPLFIRLVSPSADVFAVVAAQIFLATLGVAAVYLVTRHLFGPKAASFAGWVVAIDPVSILTANMVLTEALFTVLLFLGVALFLMTMRQPILWWASASGLLLAGATLVRPVASLVPVVLVAAALFLIRAPWSRRALVAVILIVSFCLPVGAWVLRNKARGGVATLSSVTGIILLEFRAAGAIAEEEGISFAEAQDRTHDLLADHIGRENLRQALAQRFEATGVTGLPAGLDPLPLAELEARLGREIILDRPWGALKTTIKGMGALFFGPGTETIARTTEQVASGTTHDLLRGAIVGGQLLLLCMLYAAALVGIARVRRDREAFPVLAVLVVVVACLVVVNSGPETYSRFRVPLVPLMAMIGGYGLSSIRREEPTRDQAV